MPANAALAKTQPDFRQVTQEVAAFIAKEEGLRLEAYDDATGLPPARLGGKVSGTLTIGFGHTGPDVFVGQKITEAQAYSLLDADLDEAEQAVSSGVTVPLTDNQFGALVSFTFNAGVGAFLQSTLRRRLNQGYLGAVPEQLARWDKTTINGKKVQLAALARRRAREAALWATPDKTAITHGDKIAAAPRDVNVIPLPIPTQRLQPPAKGAPLPSPDPTPLSPPVPTPIPDKRPWNSVTNLGVLITGLGGLATWLKEELQPLQDINPWFRYGFIVAIAAGVIIGFAGRIRSMIDEGR